MPVMQKQKKQNFNQPEDVWDLRVEFVQAQQQYHPNETMVTKWRHHRRELYDLVVTPDHYLNTKLKVKIKTMNQPV